VFIVYGIPLGLLAGWLRGGHLANLATLHFEWAPLAIAGLVAQLVLFSAPVASVVGDLGPPLYVASTGLVLAVVLRNHRLPGLKLVALGAISNLAAIVANGGYMPTTPEALAVAGEDLSGGYSNSIVTANPALGPLTDVFALPAWLPFANVFSIGDVLIGIGILVAVASGMSRRSGPQAAKDTLLQDPASPPVRGSTSPD
jgi:hypothetical protein